MSEQSNTTHHDGSPTDKRGAPKEPVRADRPAPVFETIQSAAAKLDTNVEALRARCRRAAQRVGDSVVAKLGGDVVAFKFGRSWRVRLPRA